MKLVTVVGARPQFIKAAPVSRELRKSFDEIIIHTGQHYDENMSPIFFKELSLAKPDFNLNIGSATHAEQTGKMLTAIAEKLVEIKPDLVLVYGDTNSTLAGALAAAKLNIPVAHVEAGLRSYNREMPEETNRVVVDHLSTLLFCPTASSVEILKKEGITKGVSFTGDVMYDVLLTYKEQIQNRLTLIETFGSKSKNYYYLTLHRAENTDNKTNLQSIFEALSKVEGKIIFPIHPRTKKAIADFHLSLPQNIKTIEPLGYLDNLTMLANAKKIITDSGGIQKEAYLLEVPCVTLRNETEWPETLENGWNTLVGADKEKIRDTVIYSSNQGDQKQFFGDGNASEKVASCLKAFLNEKESN